MQTKKNHMKNRRKFTYDPEKISSELSAFNNEALGKADRKTLQAILWTAVAVCAILAGLYMYNVLTYFPR